MRTMDDAAEQEWNATATPESPFAEALGEQANGESRSDAFARWDEMASPFAESADEMLDESEVDRLLAEALSSVQDEGFDEAVALLAEETEQAVEQRFTGEAPWRGPERERFADAHLSAVRFEAEQYLGSLAEGLAGIDVESLDEAQLDQMMERFDPQAGELTPVGEEFIGALVRKAKKAVKFVAKTAKNVAGKLIGPVLKKLHGLIKPLLKRVLSFAIGRLPAPLQPAARTLAARITREVQEDESEGPMSPATLTDLEMLAEEFDHGLAEAMIGEADPELEFENYDGGAGEAEDGRGLELLAEARGQLIDTLAAAEEEDNLAPAIEQFVPALLGALRLGINLVGRPKVVGFLAKYLAKLIGRFVGPQLSGPLSNAIVDIGMRLITLEAENEGEGDDRLGEAAPVALASVVEDTIRRFADSEEYIFENEDLMQLAAAEAFSEAVGTHFPPRFVRAGLQQAPSLGGTFVTRRPRAIRSYRKYSRVPEIDVTPQIADLLPTFGGSTVGAAMRASGVDFPMRARMHIFQAAPGTTLPGIARHDRGVGGRGAASGMHPLTPQAAGLLLREPRLGATVPPGFLRSRGRIAAGQRFYVLRPIGAAGTPPPGAQAAAAARLAPTKAWIEVNRARATINVGLYLSEADAQRVAGAMRQGHGPSALMQAMIDAYRQADRRRGAVAATREDGEDFESFSTRGAPASIATALRGRLRAWVLPALAKWARDHGEAMARAAAHPDAGVTVRVRLTAVPGFALLSQAGGATSAKRVLDALRGTPAIAISVTPGRRRA